MKITKEKIENSQAFLTIEMEPAEVEASMEKAYERLVKKANVPGFRKGKAPRPVLERHIGKDRLFENALDALIPDAYEKAVKEQEIEPFAQPQIDVTQTEPLIFKAVVPLKPSVKLGDYKNIKIEQEAPGEVTDTQIEAVIGEMRHRNADWESIELRSADYGDLVVIDLEGNIEGKTVVDQKSVPFQLRRNSPEPVFGFSEQVIGLKKGEVKTFQLQIPGDYSVSDLAGKEVTYKVAVLDINQEVLPELNDEFASMIKPELKTMEELRKSIVGDLKRSNEARVSQKFEDKVIDMVVGLSEIEFPPVLVEAEVNRIINQRFPRGREEMEAYLKRINKTPEAFHAGLHPFAANQVKNGLVLGKVTEEEKIEVTDEDVDNEISRVTNRVEDAQREGTFEVLNAPENRASIKNRLLTLKTIKRLVEIAKANIETAPKKEETNAPEEEQKAAPGKEKNEEKKKK